MPRLPVNKYIPTHVMRILVAMRDDRDFGHALICEHGVWIVGLVRRRPADCLDVLRWCLVSCVTDDDTYQRYQLNDEGRGVLTNPKHVPILYDPALRLSPRFGPTARTEAMRAQYATHISLSRRHHDHP